MESKKINQLATELTPSLADLTIIGDPSTGISKKITLSQMAALFTGTVEEYPSFSSFPVVGVADTIYIATDTNVLYRWNTGTSAYVELSPNIIASLVFNDSNGFDGTISLVGSTATLTITTTLTSGSVAFGGASGALSQDNSNFYWDNTNKRLGIATNAPTTKLDVFGTGIIGRFNGTSTNNAFLGFASNGTNRWSIGNVQSDHRFRIYNEATTSELATILSTGEFGIGISNPTTKFHIDGATSALIVNLDADVSIAKSISFRSDNSNRWNIEVSGTESTGNAGMDFFLRSYSDAGALIETPFSIVRSTGVTTIKSLTLTNALSIANGGTGATTKAGAFDALSPMTTLGDVIYGGASGTGTRLAGNTTTTRQFLRQTGTGAASAAPVWDTVTKTDVGLSNVENTALSTWAGSSNITTLGTITTGTWNGTTIAVANGGTGATTFTAGRILFGNGTSAINTSANLFWDNTNGRLGVGTATPSNPLHIQSNTTSQLNVTALSGNTNAQINLEPTGTGIAVIGPANAVDLVLRTNAVTRVTINGTNGQVGIGVTPSAWGSSIPALQVAAYGSFSTSGGVDTQISNNAYYDGTNWRYIASQEVANYYMNRDTHVWRYKSAGTAGGTITWNEAMRLTNAGDLGLGVVSPSYKLHLKASSGSTTGIRLESSGGTSNFDLLSSEGDGNAYLYLRSNYSMLFGTNNIERMRITSGGNVGIGTNSPVSFGSTNTVLSVNNVNGGGGGGVFVCMSDGNQGLRMAVDSSSSALWEPRNVYFRIATNDTERMRITSGGEVLIGTTSSNSFNFVAGGNSKHSYLGNTMQISASDFGGTERQGAIGVAEWGGVSNPTIDLASIFPRMTFTSRAFSALVQITTSTTTTTSCSALVLFARTINGTWSSSIISNININGLALSSVSGSGTSITLNFGTTNYGVAKIHLINRA